MIAKIFITPLGQTPSIAAMFEQKRGAEDVSLANLDHIHDSRELSIKS